MYAVRRGGGVEIAPGLIIGPLSGGNKVLWKETTAAGEQIASLRSTLEARRMYIRLCLCTTSNSKNVFVRLLKSSIRKITKILHYPNLFYF